MGLLGRGHSGAIVTSRRIRLVGGFAVTVALASIVALGGGAAIAYRSIGDLARSKPLPAKADKKPKQIALPSAPEAPDDEFKPRRVRTFSVRSDGTIIR